MGSWNGFIVNDDFEADLEALIKAKKDVVARLTRLMCECLSHPRMGIGRPKPLQGYSNREVWSRRITEKHRLVYEIRPDAIVFLACYGHYDDH